jgi:hypothetical protein
MITDHERYGGCHRTRRTAGAATDGSGRHAIDSEISGDRTQPADRRGERLGDGGRAASASHDGDLLVRLVDAGFVRPPSTELPCVGLLSGDGAGKHVRSAHPPVGGEVPEEAHLDGKVFGGLPNTEGVAGGDCHRQPRCSI